MMTPPIIRSEAKPPPGLSATRAFSGLLGLLAVARLSVEWHLPLPFCGLKRLTGVPCPFCGGTRCLQACSSFDFGDALRWNPLVFLVCIGTALWFALWTGDRLFRREWLATIRRRLVTPALRRLIIGGVVLNWIYLCLTLS